jgi:signal recognition particle subunit SRP19
MSNPRIEEVDDDDVSDPEEMDLEEFDFAKPGQATLAPAMNPAQSQIDPAMLQQMMNAQGGQQAPQMNVKERLRREQEAKEKTKMYQCLYPVYFDASRSREEGRRVSKEDAVSNPLAREIVEALQHIGNSKIIPLQVAFEPSKTHPKDWANPGRVRVLVKKDGKAVSAKVANSKP